VAGCCRQYRNDYSHYGQEKYKRASYQNHFTDHVRLHQIISSHLSASAANRVTLQARYALMIGALKDAAIMKLVDLNPSTKVSCLQNYRKP
jgi:hypothetical protein